MNRDRLGIPLRNHLRNQMTTMSSGETLIIDFGDIKEMTTSVAEEVGPRLFQEFLAYRMQAKKDVYIAYCNASQEIANGLEGAFRAWQPHSDSPKKLTIVAFKRCQHDRFVEHRFLGEVIPEALNEALDLVYRSQQINSLDLEARGIKAASRKLNELFRQYPWLLRRFQKSLDAGPRAWAYFYSPIVPVCDPQE
jgi:hypothetical protein